MDVLTVCTISVRFRSLSYTWHRRRCALSFVCTCIAARSLPIIALVPSYVSPVPALPGAKRHTQILLMFILKYC